MIFVYGRVSTKEQKIDRQEDAFDGVQFDESFYDEGASGKNLDRPEFRRMVGKLRKGDIVVVKSIDRLSRSVMDFSNLWDEWKKMGVSLKVLDLGIELTPGNENGMSEFIINIMVAAAQLERGMIRQRQLEGMRAAYARGKGKRGESKHVTEARERIKQMKDAGFTDETAMKMLGVSQGTYYKLKKEVMNEQKVLVK